MGQEYYGIAYLKKGVKKGKHRTFVAKVRAKNEAEALYFFKVLWGAKFDGATAFCAAVYREPLGEEWKLEEDALAECRRVYEGVDESGNGTWGLELV